MPPSLVLARACSRAVAQTVRGPRLRARALPEVHPDFLHAVVATCTLAAAHAGAGAETTVRCLEALPLPPIAEQVAVVRRLRAAFAAAGGVPDASVVGALAWMLARGDGDGADDLLHAVVAERSAMARARELVGSVAEELLDMLLVVADDPAS